MKIARNSAAGHFSTFRGLLKIAFRGKRIKENVNDFLAFPTRQVCRLVMCSI